MTNAQKTLVRLWLKTLQRVALQVEREIHPEEEAQEWAAIRECLEAKATNPSSQMGDTWSLQCLGGKSPSWTLGIQSNH